tara:strand:+ start:340 stop:849 length:510 start_codon:yes stop_codon:yes gene_type:complete
MDKGTKMRTFAEHVEVKTLEEICDMPLHEANMQLDMNEGAADAALNFVVDQGIKVTKGLFKYGSIVAKLGAKGAVKGGKGLKQYFSKQEVADRKRAKAMKKADRLTKLRMSKEDLFAARERIELERKRLGEISADEKALNKAKIAQAKKELDSAYKEVEKGIKKLRGIK